MTGAASVDGFLAGVAFGLTFLLLTTYRHVSPAWLKQLLMSLALLLAARYAALALLTPAEEQLWQAVFPVLALSSVMAIDHVIRHPAMTPKKLLAWVAPAVAVDGAVILLNAFRLASLFHLLIAIGFSAACVMLARKIPSPPIRQALAALAAGQLLLVAVPGLPSEMAMLMALWFAYDTGTRLQQSG